MTIISITKTITTVGPLRLPSISDLQLLTIIVTTTTTITTPDQIHITTVTTASPTVYNLALEETDGQKLRLQGSSEPSLGSLTKAHESTSKEIAPHPER
jgi:hypothetical protein